MSPPIWPAVAAEVQDAARAAGRAPGEITLIAVSKGHPASRILPALAAGHTTYGENRVQEASEKWQALRTEWPGAALHYIGALQTNKVRDAVAIADAIHAIDRPKLAAALAREMERQGRRPDCFIQVNTGAEPQKAGILPDGLDALVARCRDDLMLPVTGLMCIPPADEDPSPHFALCGSSPRATPQAPEHGHVGRLPDCDRARRHPRPDRYGDLRGPSHALIPAGRHSSGRNAEPGPPTHAGRIVSKSPAATATQPAVGA